MNDVKKFKDLLAYFVVHLEYVQTGKTNGIGYDKFLKPLEPLTVDNDFYKTGQGYNNDNIQHQIEDWQEIKRFPNLYYCCPLNFKRHDKTLRNASKHGVADSFFKTKPP